MVHVDQPGGGSYAVIINVSEEPVQGTHYILHNKVSLRPHTLFAHLGGLVWLIVFIRLVLLRGVFVCSFCSLGVLGVWIVGFQMGWFARLPLSFSFLDVVMLFIGRRVVLDDIVFVCLYVGITDVFVLFLLLV